MAKACADCGGPSGSIFSRGQGYLCTPCAVKPDEPTAPTIMVVSPTPATPTLGDLLMSLGFSRNAK